MDKLELYHILHYVFIYLQRLCGFWRELFVLAPSVKLKIGRRGKEVIMKPPPLTNNKQQQRAEAEKLSFMGVLFTFLQFL